MKENAINTILYLPAIMQTTNIILKQNPISNAGKVQVDTWSSVLLIPY